MELNERTKIQLRKRIVAKLNTVPEGQKIHLDKELLEQLLFEYVPNTNIKLPYWCGKFLSKIDLSEISFEDVSWNILNPNYDIRKEDVIPYINLLYGMNVEEYIINGFVRQINEINTRFYYENLYISDLYDDFILFENTNANIDFTKSFEAKNGLGVCISNCNFSGTNFSDLDIGVFDRLECVDFSNTGIKVTNMEKFINGSFLGVGLNNIDLSNISIDYDLVRNIHDNSYIWIKGTKLNITSSQNNLDLDEINEAGFMDGCYFNGELITCSKSSTVTFNDTRKEYKKMYEELFTSVMQSIDEQGETFKK